MIFNHYGRYPTIVNNRWEDGSLDDSDERYNELQEENLEGFVESTRPEELDVLEEEEPELIREQTQERQNEFRDDYYNRGG